MAPDKLRKAIIIGYISFAIVSLVLKWLREQALVETRRWVGCELPSLTLASMRGGIYVLVTLYPLILV